MKNNSNNTKTSTVEQISLEDLLERKIVVFNDDFNSFDHVIQTFCEILQHTPEQAEQCATMIHYKGKCKVKSGEYDELVPLCITILQRGINAEIQ